MNDEKEIVKIYSKETVELYKKSRPKSFFNEHVVNPAFRKKAIQVGVLKKETLDMGCGYGADLEFFIDNGAKKIMGIDISQACIDVALSNKKLQKNGVVINKCSAYEMKFNNKFKLVLSNLLLDQIKDLNKVFNNVSLSLKKNGDFLFSVAHPINSATNDYKKPLKEYFNNDIESYKPKTLSRKLFYYKRTFEDLSVVLMRSGFAIIEIIEPRPTKMSYLKHFKKAKKYSRLPCALIIHARKIN